MKNHIKKLRREKRLTQEELARILGVSRQTISAIESGRYHPSLKLAFQIGRVMDMQLEEIFFYGDDDDQ